MVARGYVKNGVVVLADGLRLLEGQEVIVQTVSPDPAKGRSVPEGSQERRKALLELIGICKTDNPPDDAEVERIREQELMSKYS